NPIPGMVGSGTYTFTQITFFQRVQRALATQQAVGFGTKEDLPGPVTGHGHSSGEAKVLGLLGRHAYSVLDTKIEGKRRYFLIRNPGAQYHREYTEHFDRSLTPRAAGDHAFSHGDTWLELTDFFINFYTDFKASPPIQDAARQALMSDLAGQLQAQRGRLAAT